METAETKQQNSLTQQELALFMGCKIQTKYRTAQGEGFPMKKEIGTLVDVDMLIPEKVFAQFDFEKDTLDCTTLYIKDIKPMLRPIASMTDNEVLDVCEIAKRLPFQGNCIRSKWVIKRGTHGIEVGCPKNDYSFTIYCHNDTGYGDVNVYREAELDQVNDIGLIIKYYLSKHLDCFGWIDEGKAIDATKECEK